MTLLEAVQGAGLRTTALNGDIRVHAAGQDSLAGRDAAEAAALHGLQVQGRDAPRDFHREEPRAAELLPLPDGGNPAGAHLHVRLLGREERP